MVRFFQIIILFSLLVVPLTVNANDSNKENHFERMDFYLEQALWKFEDGNFIVYRTKKGSLDYVLFSELPTKYFKTDVYKSDQNNAIDSLKVEIGKRSTTYKFSREKLLVLFIYKDEKICNDYIEISSEDWRVLAQDFSKQKKNSEQYSTLYNFFKRKAKKCR